MTGYSSTLRKHARLAILRFLEDAPQHTSNASMLAELLPGVGVVYTRDQIVTELTWLKDQGFVELDDLGSVLVAEATERGVEIANGVGRHPEFAKRRPGS